MNKVSSVFFSLSSMALLALLAEACNTTDKIYVIGAGISGLAAAKELRQLGFCNVTIVEARGRAGGRLLTDSSLGFPVDLGAAWIHGVANNPVRQFAADETIDVTSYSWDDGELYDENGALVSASKYQAMETDLWNVLDAVAVWAENLDSDTTLQNAIDAVLPKKTLSYPDYFPFMLRSEVIEEYAADPVNLSAWWWDIGAELTGGEAVFPSGYTQITEAYETWLVEQGVTFLYDTPITKIVYDANGVQLTTASQAKLSGVRAVCTIPVSLLKSQSSTLFSPALPSNKLASLNRLGVGVLNKVVLKFSRIFWRSVTYEGMIQQIPRWTTIIFLNKWVSGAPVIVATVTGSVALDIELKTDAQVVAELMTALRTLYPSAPDPIDYLVTRWAADSYAKGSYSCAGVGTTPKDYDILAQSVSQTLFFAGEHTNRTHMSTTHGALASGLRAARQIGAIYGLAENPDMSTGDHIKPAIPVFMCMLLAWWTLISFRE